MRRPGVPPPRLAGLAFAVAAALLTAGCSSSGTVKASGTTVAPTTVTVAPTTTTMPATTLYRPSAPQPSREAAASHLVAAWRGGDQAAALADATPAAVSALFAHPYPKGAPQFRQCSQAVAGPSFCDYRVDNALLDLSVVMVPGGWSVDTATYEG